MNILLFGESWYITFKGWDCATQVGILLSLVGLLLSIGLWALGFVLGIKQGKTKTKVNELTESLHRISYATSVLHLREKIGVIPRRAKEVLDDYEYAVSMLTEDVSSVLPLYEDAPEGIQQEYQDTLKIALEALGEKRHDADREKVVTRVMEHARDLADRGLPELLVRVEEILKDVGYED